MRHDSQRRPRPIERPVPQQVPTQRLAAGEPIALVLSRAEPRPSLPEFRAVEIRRPDEGVVSTEELETVLRELLDEQRSLPPPVARVPRIWVVDLPAVRALDGQERHHGRLQHARAPATSTMASAAPNVTRNSRRSHASATTKSPSESAVTGAASA